MNLDDFLGILRRRWILVVAATLVGGVLGAMVYLLTPTTYTATVTLYVYSQTGTTPDDAYQGSLASEMRVSSYTDLVSGDRVTEDVVSRLRLPDAPGELAGRINASSAADSALIDVAVTDRDAASAARTGNAVAESFIAVVNDLERPSAPGTAQQVLVRAVKPASVPVAPASPGLPLTLAVGALLGLCVGAITAVVLSSLDKSVRDVARLARTTKAPALGTIYHDPKLVKAPILETMGGRSGFAESFRTLRTNIEFVDVDSPSQIVLFTSSVEGEGKSTTVTGLAVALASAGKRVIVVDADLRRPSVAESLGLDGSVGLTSVLAGRIGLDDALQAWGPGTTRVLASGPLPPNPSELLDSRQARDVFRALRGKADYVLVDTPPVLPVTDAATAARRADAVVLVCRVGRTTVAQVEEAVRTLGSASARLAGTVATMVPAPAASAYLSNAPAASQGETDGPAADGTTDAPAPTPSPIPTPARAAPTPATPTPPARSAPPRSTPSASRLPSYDPEATVETPSAPASEPGATVTRSASVPLRRTHRRRDEETQGA